MSRKTQGHFALEVVLKFSAKLQDVSSWITMHSLSGAFYKILCVMTQTMGHPALLSTRLTLNKLPLAGQLSKEGKILR